MTDNEQKERDELFAMAQRAVTTPPTQKPAPAVFKPLETIDPRMMAVHKTWSNDELNGWLRAALDVERETIRKLTVKGLTGSQTKFAEALADQFNTFAENLRTELKAAFDQHISTANENTQRLNVHIIELQEQIDELKANYKKGWFK